MTKLIQHLKFYTLCQLGRSHHLVGYAQRLRNAPKQTITVRYGAKEQNISAKPLTASFNKWKDGDRGTSFGGELKRPRLLL